MLQHYCDVIVSVPAMLAQQQSFVNRHVDGRYSHSDARSNSSRQIAIDSRQFAGVHFITEIRIRPINGDPRNQRVDWRMPTLFMNPTSAKGSRERHLFTTSMS